MSNLNRFDGRRVIVTGGASGIGEAVAKRFLYEGARVLVVDLDETAFAQNHADGRASFLRADIADTDAPARIVEAATTALGGIDIVVNQAGIGIYKPVEALTDEDWARVQAVNVTAMFRIARAAVPHLRNSPAGRIINTSSIMGSIGDDLMTAYSTSKHAVVGLTRNLALDLAKDGITVNFIEPGPTATASAKIAFDQMPEYEEFWLKRVPLGRLASPQDVASAVLFLASDEASYITGTGLRIDGGTLARP